MTALDSTSAPVAPRSRAGQVAWVFADFARDPLISLVAAFVFAPYFVEVIIGDAVRGQALWGFATGAASMMLAFGGPIFGAIADQTGRRKPWVATFTILGTLCSFALWLILPETPHAGLFAMILVAVALACDDASLIFTNAMLPHIADTQMIGRLSGIGWALGFVASSMCLAAFMGLGDVREAMGLTGEDFVIERLSGVVSGAWFFCFMMPLLLLTPDTPATGVPPRVAIRNGLKTLFTTVRAVRHYQNFALYIASALGFFSALMAFYSFSGLYAASLFGWGVGRTSLYGLVSQLTGASLALASGFLDDRFGPRRILLMSVAGSLLVALAMAAVTPVGFGPFVWAEASLADAALSERPQELLYIALGSFQVGMLGMMLVSGRSMVSRIAPLEMMTEFFGLFGMFGRAGAFVAPFFISWLTLLTDSPRIGLFGVTTVLYAIGFVLLLGVREERSEPHV